MRNKSSETVSNNAQLSALGRPPVPLFLSGPDRRELMALLGSGRLRPGHARRLRVILLSLEGRPAAEIARDVGMSRFHVSRVRRRFERGGMASLADRPRPGRVATASPERVRQVLQTVASAPPAGAERWTLSMLARTVGLSRSVIYRLLRTRGIDLARKR
jgi:transposase